MARAGCPIGSNRGSNATVLAGAGRRQSARLEVATKGPANDIGGSGVLRGGPLVQGLTQLGVEPHGEGVRRP